jgi:transcriptional regulator with GAF, ATPase, and Fis domain
VRELRNVIERAMILDPVRGLDGVDLLPATGAPAGPGADAAAAVGQDLNLREALNRLEQELVVEALRRSSGVRKEAAHLLGIDPRNLSYYMRKHGLESEPS